MLRTIYGFLTSNGLGEHCRLLKFALMAGQGPSAGGPDLPSQHRTSSGSDDGLSEPRDPVSRPSDLAAEGPDGTPPDLVGKGDPTSRAEPNQAGLAALGEQIAGTRRRRGGRRTSAKRTRRRRRVRRGVLIGLVVLL